jgi:hypothetical protein
MTRDLAAGIAIIVGAVVAGATAIALTPDPQTQTIYRDRNLVNTVTAPPVTLPPVVETRTVYVERASRNDRPKAQPKVGATGEYQTYARGKVPAAQWPCLRQLWQKESGWNPSAANPTSSAYGIPQMLRMKPGTPWRTQIDRGLGYIAHRYGTPCAAWGHSQRNGWY